MRDPFNGLRHEDSFFYSSVLLILLTLFAQKITVRGTILVNQFVCFYFMFVQLSYLNESQINPVFIKVLTFWCFPFTFDLHALFKWPLRNHLDTIIAPIYFSTEFVIKQFYFLYFQYWSLIRLNGKIIDVYIILSRLLIPVVFCTFWGNSWHKLIFVLIVLFHLFL